MSFVTDFTESIRDRYRCNCVDGKCVGCGECCSDLLPVTRQEIDRIKQYVKKHRLKEHRHNVFVGVSDCTCPFRNEITQRCDVYEVRPEICRSFICSKTLADTEKDRDLLTEHRDAVSMRYEIFGNDENVRMLLGARIMISAFMS